MELYLNKGRYSDNVNDYFQFNKLDVTHSSEYLKCLFGENWFSILIVENGNALLHAFTKNKIPDTDYYDIEPFIGYSGQIVNTASPDFIGKAITKYTDFCNSEKIIAEIIRFNPLLQNHSAFSTNTQIKVFPAKEIVIVDCFNNDEDQLKSFSKIGRYETKKALNTCEKNVNNKAEGFDAFLKLYYNSLNRVGAEKKWYFYPEFFERTRESALFEIYSVSFNNIIISSAMVIFHPLASYYFIAANETEMPLGANNFLLFNIARDSAKRGINKLILGGGNTPDDDDSLLRFKKKFAKKTVTFYMGKLLHNENVYNRLCSNAVKENPKLKDVNYFLKYRL